MKSCTGAMFFECRKRTAGPDAPSPHCLPIVHRYAAAAAALHSCTSVPVYSYTLAASSSLACRLGVVGWLQAHGVPAVEPPVELKRERVARPGARVQNAASVDGDDGTMYTMSK